jgi:hypothetical protein
VTRRLLVLAGLLAVLLGGRVPASAREPLPAASRERAERAFLDGRLDDLDAILGASADPVDVEALALRDLYWRPREGVEERYRPAASGPSLSARRIAWCLAPPPPGGARPPYPVPAVGEGDPWRRLAALVADREDREARGARALAGAGPLPALHDPEVDWFVDNYARTALVGAPRSPEDEERAASARSLARRNRTVGLAAVAGYLALGALLAFLASRRPAR